MHAYIHTTTTHRDIYTRESFSNLPNPFWPKETKKHFLSLSSSSSLSKPFAPIRYPLVEKGEVRDNRKEIDADEMFWFLARRFLCLDNLTFQTLVDVSSLHWFTSRGTWRIKQKMADKGGNNWSQRHHAVVDGSWQTSWNSEIAMNFAFADHPSLSCKTKDSHN